MDVRLLQPHRRETGGLKTTASYWVKRIHHVCRMNEVALVPPEVGSYRHRTGFLIVAHHTRCTWCHHARTLPMSGKRRQGGQASVAGTLERSVLGTCRKPITEFAVCSLDSLCISSEASSVGTKGLETRGFGISPARQCHPIERHFRGSSIVCSGMTKSTIELYAVLRKRCQATGTTVAIRL